MEQKKKNTIEDSSGKGPVRNIKPLTDSSDEGPDHSNSEGYSSGEGLVQDIKPLTDSSDEKHDSQKSSSSDSEKEQERGRPLKKKVPVDSKKLKDEMEQESSPKKYADPSLKKNASPEPRKRMSISSDEGRSAFPGSKRVKGEKNKMEEDTRERTPSPDKFRR